MKDNKTVSQPNQPPLDAPEPGVKKPTFTRYQAFIIAIVALLQFTIILDFMVLSPLGAILLKELHITTGQFGAVVSAYAFSAGLSGLLAAGFADKFDRKKLLLFFYIGFIGGTVLCAIAPTFEFLLGARIVTGIFGGVIGSIGFAIITDLFKMEVRGRVMGFVQMAFAASQILGIPLGLYLSNKIGWHAPFWMIASFGLVLGVVILLFMKPVTEHLKLQRDHSALQHLGKIITKRDHLTAFLATGLLATGGFMLMPFGSAFSTNNLGIAMEDLPILYGVTGIFAIVFGPLVGKLSDKVGKYPVFIAGTVISIVLVLIYCNLGPSSLAFVSFLNVILFLGITARIISSSALLTAVPLPQDRGAFMSVNSSVQQVAGGIASAIAGTIVIQQSEGAPLDNYPLLGYVVCVTMVIVVFLMYFLNRLVKRKLSIPQQQPV